MTLGTMKALILAMTTGTTYTYKGKVNVVYIFCKTRTSHLVLLNPTMAKRYNNGRIEWILFRTSIIGLMP